MARVVVIAGTRSGCGKTTVAVALMAALVRRGLAVQAFKAGPDFIDPGLHQLVTGRPSHNLDGWMLGPAGVCDVFARYAAGADVAVVEGVMGLYDGFSGADEAGSTAQLAKWLHAPVLLVVDARSMARSLAAEVRGYVGFDAGLRFAGVVCNKVGTPSHAGLLAEAMTLAPGVELLGCLRREAGLELPSRHLGLVTAGDVRGMLGPDFVGRLADWFEDGVSVGRLAAVLPDAPVPSAAELLADLPGSPGPESAPESMSESASDEASAPEAVDPGPRARIGVALDEAFCFYYPENWRHLVEAGAELVFFSPLRDAELPVGASGPGPGGLGGLDGLDGLYLGGGYPELHARELAANEPMRAAVRELAASGAPIYAECGGFMYLMRSLRTGEGEEFPMCGVFGLRCAMTDRFRALGYREAVLREDGLLGPAWTVVRGHEFHYSHILEESGTEPDEGPCAEPGATAAEDGPLTDVPRAVYRVRTRSGWSDIKEGFVAGAAPTGGAAEAAPGTTPEPGAANVLGSYIHLHFGSNPEAARAFVDRCAAHREAAA
ncbi:MAG: cobyrinate a,c-diamide synthase [Desulfovibrionaceae bacterium]|jgi:cobyrinic acid a,c-diamide synthase|nr:cobyrinate a,c-diamide synthase [Desulfovibrionaceae bacterium]